MHATVGKRGTTEASLGSKLASCLQREAQDAGQRPKGESRPKEKPTLSRARIVRRPNTAVESGDV